MLGGDGGQRAHPAQVVVQAGDVVELGAARVQKRLAGLHVDFFQRFQAVAGEAGAHHIHFLRTCLGHGHQRGLGVGLQPLGFAKARLEGDGVLVLAQAQRLGDQTPGFVALAVVGVAQVQGALGHAMKTHYQLVGLAVGLPVFAHGGGQCIDVAGVVVKVVDETQLGHVAGALGPLVNGVEQRSGGGAAVLGVGGQHQHAGEAFGLELVQLLCHAGVAIGHGHAHVNVVALFTQKALQQFGLFLRPYHQWGALWRPHAGVFGG